MSDRLPPLTALRAFEAAARHLSFAKAADELNVTPAALSFQIKSLEDHLGAPVFRRLNRAVELTDIGHSLAPRTSDAFAILGSAWSHARRQLRHDSLTVTAGPGITALWLAPRIFSFAADHPDIDVRFSANLRLMDLARDDVDVAIRYGQGDDAGLHRRILQYEYVTPMMTPEIARDINGPEDLLNFPLLRDDLTQQISPHASWRVWLRAHGLDEPDHLGPRFNQADHAIGAALAGVGVLLGRVCLTSGEVSQGRLVAPFRTAISTGGSYRALCAKGLESRPTIAAFLDWIESETKDFSRPIQGYRIVSVQEAEDLSDG